MDRQKKVLNMPHTPNWIPLTDYSNKYKVSISTLRRRIKLENIPFKLASGKYFLLDESPSDATMAKKSQINLFEDNKPPLKKMELKAEPRMAMPRKDEAPPES